MKSDRVIESAIRAAQNLLWQNLPPTHKLPDAAAVARLRDLVRSPAVKSALLHSNDTFLAFVLRAVEFVLADQFRADREIIDHLWDVLDDPQLNKALGLPQEFLLLWSVASHDAATCPAEGRLGSCLTSTRPISGSRASNHRSPLGLR